MINIHRKKERNSFYEFHILFNTWSLIALDSLFFFLIVIEDLGTGSLKFQANEVSKLLCRKQRTCFINFF